MLNRKPFKLQSGRALGQHYIIEDSLGWGWEGEVYRIREKRTGIIRAAKIFFDQKGIREAPLLRYARKLYKLKACPIIIQYHHHDTAKINGQRLNFLVSDFVDGEILSVFLSRQPQKKMGYFEALHLIYTLAVGLEQIHHLGEYHGDIHSDNIMVKRHGIGFNVHLIDFLDIGRPTRAKIQTDIIDLIAILHESIGGIKSYAKAPDQIKQIILGRKHSLISNKFKTAGQLRTAIENLKW